MFVLILLALAALGLILGSFANALVWRLHAQEDLQDQVYELQDDKPAKMTAKARDKKVAELKAQIKPLTMSHGRSMCSNCHHPLAPKDLVPLFSYLSLKGKCRYCHKPIQDTPWLEALLPVAFVLSYVFWPLDMTGYGLLAFGFWLVFLTAFAALTVYDMRWFLLPDKVVWPIVVLAGLQVLLHAFVYGGGTEVLLTACWGVLIGSGVFYVLHKVSNGEWIGFGDVKLGIALGLLVGGPMQAILLIFLASLLGTVASLPQLVRRKLRRTSVIPFGPFLMAAAVILVLFGQQLMAWLDQLIAVQ